MLRFHQREVCAKFVENRTTLLAAIKTRKYKYISKYLSE